MIKRYNIWGMYDFDIQEAAEGDYVLYDDHVVEVKG